MLENRNTLLPLSGEISTGLDRSSTVAPISFSTIITVQVSSHENDDKIWIRQVLVRGARFLSACTAEVLVECSTSISECVLKVLCSRDS